MKMQSSPHTRWVSPMLSEEEVQALPLITLGVLSYNRKDDLRGTLDILTSAVWYPRKEIIVVDNSSTDGSLEMVRALFPEVRVLSLEKNVGIEARNFLFKAAKGKYIFSFDDDSFPATPYVVFEAVQLLERKKYLAALCFQCYQPRTDFCETLKSEATSLRIPEPGLYEGLHFIEGAMCYRTEMLRNFEGYDKEFFWGAEGLDLALEFFKQNLYSVYQPNLQCLHMRSTVNRNLQLHYRFTRNYIWTIAKHFPLFSLPLVLLLFILRRLTVCAMHPTLAPHILSGMLAGTKGIVKQRKKTTKLSLRQMVELRPWYRTLYRW